MDNFNASKTKELLIIRSKTLRQHLVHTFKKEAIMTVDSSTGIKRVDKIRQSKIHLSLDLCWGTHLDLVRSSCMIKLSVTL